MLLLVGRLDVVKLELVAVRQDKELVRGIHSLPTPSPAEGFLFLLPPASLRELKRDCRAAGATADLAHRQAGLPD